MVAALASSVLDKEHLFQSWYGPLIGLAIVGFCVGVAGHLFQFRTLVVLGITMVFAAVLVVPIVLYVRGTP